MTTTRPARRAALVAGAAVLAALPLAGPAVAGPASSSTTASDEPSDERSSRATGTPSSRASGGTSSPSGDAVSFPSTVTSDEGVEVSTYGVVQVKPYQDQGEPPVTFAVHGVQRVEGGTVVYLSVGWGEDRGDARPVGFSEVVSTQIGGRFGGGGGITDVRVVEREAGRVLSTLLEPAGSGIQGAFASESRAFPAGPGEMVALYAVVPELAPGTETVDVQVGFGLTVPDVPVGEGLLEPGLPPDEPVPLGTGWPEVDLDDVAAAPEPDRSVHQLVEVVQALDLSTTTTETTEQVSIDVAADVLFAFDSADLTPDATATLQRVGDDVVARAAGGRLQVVGHTDAESSDAYNDDLSLRRAQAAAQVLAPYAQQAGLELVVEGRGEREPVADNGSDEGRQANRRVTVTFDVAEAAQP